MEGERGVRLPTQLLQWLTLATKLVACIQEEHLRKHLALLIVAAEDQNLIGIDGADDGPLASVRKFIDDLPGAVRTQAELLDQHRDLSWASADDVAALPGDNRAMVVATVVELGKRTEHMVFEGERPGRRLFVTSLVETASDEKTVAS